MLDRAPTGLADRALVIAGQRILAQLAGLARVGAEGTEIVVAVRHHDIEVAVVKAALSVVKTAHGNFGPLAVHQLRRTLRHGPCLVGAALAQPDIFDAVAEPIGAGLQLTCRFHRPTDHLAIALGDVIQHLDRLGDLLQADGLLAARTCDIAQQGGHLADRVDCTRQQIAATFDGLHAVRHLVARMLDQFFDFRSGLRATLRQGPHFCRDHGETAAGIASPGRFHGGVKREDIGLESDAVDYAEHLPHFVRTLLDTFDACDRSAHRLLSRDRIGMRTGGPLIGLLRLIGVVTHGFQQGFERRPRLLKAGSLRLGALRQRGGMFGRLGAAHRDQFRFAADASHDLRELVSKQAYLFAERRQFVAARQRHVPHQIAFAQGIQLGPQGRDCAE